MIRSTNEQIVACSAVCPIVAEASIDQIVACVSVKDMDAGGPCGIVKVKIIKCYSGFYEVIFRASFNAGIAL